MALRHGQREASIETKVLRELLGFIKEGEVIVGATYLHVGGDDGPHRVVFLLEKVDEEAPKD